eukprot:PhM_4_TR3239/c0_g1_i1/m.19108
MSFRPARSSSQSVLIYALAFVLFIAIHIVDANTVHKRRTRTLTATAHTLTTSMSLSAPFSHTVSVRTSPAGGVYNNITTATVQTAPTNIVFRVTSPDGVTLVPTTATNQWSMRYCTLEEAKSDRSQPSVCVVSSRTSEDEVPRGFLPILRRELHNYVSANTSSDGLTLTLTLRPISKYEHRNAESVIFFFRKHGALFEPFGFHLADDVSVTLHVDDGRTALMSSSCIILTVAFITATLFSYFWPNAMRSRICSLLFIYQTLKAPSERALGLPFLLNPCSLNYGSGPLKETEGSALYTTFLYTLSVGLYFTYDRFASVQLGTVCRAPGWTPILAQYLLPVISFASVRVFTEETSAPELVSHAFSLCAVVVSLVGHLWFVLCVRPEKLVSANDHEWLGLAEHHLTGEFSPDKRWFAVPEMWWVVMFSSVAGFRATTEPSMATLCLGLSAMLFFHMVLVLVVRPYNTVVDIVAVVAADALSLGVLLLRAQWGTDVGEITLATLSSLILLDVMVRQVYCTYASYNAWHHVYTRESDEFEERTKAEIRALAIELFQKEARKKCEENKRRRRALSEYRNISSKISAERMGEDDRRLAAARRRVRRLTMTANYTEDQMEADDHMLNETQRGVVSASVRTRQSMMKPAPKSAAGAAMDVGVATTHIMTDEHHRRRIREVALPVISPSIAQSSEQCQTLFSAAVHGSPRRTGNDVRDEVARLQRRRELLEQKESEATHYSPMSLRGATPATKWQDIQSE